LHFGKINPFKLINAMSNILTIGSVGILLLVTSCQKDVTELTPVNTNQTTSEEPNISSTSNNPSVFLKTTKSLTTTVPSSNLGLLEYLKGELDYSIFYKALFRTGIDIDLSNDGSFTIFIPSNEAFQTFFIENNYTSLDDIPQNILTTIVDLEVSTTITLFLSGKEIYINLKDPINPFVVLGSSKASFIERDLEQLNGVVHKINGVLLK
jgi:uncharacterized surface protein with fasciclin (FAS1) repeats